MPAPERTLVLLKPDAVQRGLVGALISRFEATGLRIAAMKLIQMDEALAKKHYAVHQGKPFFAGLVQFITSGPIMAMVLEGPRAIEIVRKAMGATDPAKAAPGSIRGDLAVSIGMNLVHGSDGPETAAREVALFFSAKEIIGYQRSLDRWIVE